MTDSPMERGRASPLGEEGAREEGASEVWPKEGKPEEHCLLTMIELPAVAMKQRFRHLRFPHFLHFLFGKPLRFDSPEHEGTQLGGSGRAPKAMSSIQNCKILKTRNWDEKRLMKNRLINTP